MKKHPYLTEIIVFLALMAIMLSGIYNVVRYKNVGSGGGMDNFYSTKVPIDVVIYGSSHAACTVNNGILWNDYGIASYTLSAGAQNIAGTYYFLQESIAVNKPKVALIETYLMTENQFALDSFYRSALTTRFSTRFVSFILETIKNNSLDRKTAEDMLLRMPIVHSRYSELEKSDFVNSEAYIRGYRGDNSIIPISTPQKTDRFDEISADTLEYIDKMIDLCKKNGVEPIFFNAPYEIDEATYARQNTLCDYVESKGCDYLGFNRDYEQYGIDYSSDFRDDGHLNDTGAAKVTRALAEYIKNNFSVEDRRGNAGYESWDQHLVYLADKTLRYQLNDCTSIENYLSCICENAKDKTIILSLNGNYRALGDEIYQPYLEQLGIDNNTYEKGGVWVIRNGEITCYSEGESEFIAYQQLGTSTDLNIYKKAGNEYPHILIDDADLSPDCNGISVIVYDEICEYTVQAMKMNIFEGTDTINMSLPE